MRKIEILILAIFFGLVPVMAIFMATVLFAAVVFGKETLGPWILWAMLPGVLIDVLFLKRWVKNAYTMSTKAIGGLYIFYSVCALGFFMGVPIGCIFLSIPAGIYSARRFMLGSDKDFSSENYFRRTAVFTAAVMVLICALLALWAVAGKMIGYRLETPLVSFTFTPAVFWAVVFAGGAFLVLLQYWLTSTAAKVTFNLSN